MALHSCPTNQTRFNKVIIFVRRIRATRPLISALVDRNDIVMFKVVRGHVVYVDKYCFNTCYGEAKHIDAD